MENKIEIDSSVLSANTRPFFTDDVVRSIADFIIEYCEVPDIELEFRLGRFRWNRHHMPPDLEAEQRERDPYNELPTPLFNIGNASEVVLNRLDPDSRSPCRYEFDAESVSKEHFKIIFEHIKRAFLNLRKETIRVNKSLELNETRTDQFGDPIRVSKDMQKEDSEYKYLHKKRLENLDILLPGADYDMRISASVETEKFNCVFSDEELNVVTREKNRKSFHRIGGVYDLTEVTSYNRDEPEVKNVHYEVEFELSKKAVKELKELKSTATSLSSEFVLRIADLTNNMREMAYLTTGCYPMLKMPKGSSEDKKKRKE